MVITMRLNIVKSKNTSQFYAIKSTYINGKHSSKIVHKLGNLEEVTIKANGEDPIVWAKKQVAKLTELENAESNDIIVKYSQNKLIPTNNQSTFNIGYLFLQKIYYDLKIDKICKSISNDYKFEYDLNNILSRLIYSRILFPGSKLSTFTSSKKFVEQPNFELHDLYRSLSVIASNDEMIQSSLYKNSSKLIKRNSEILYYDCTNFFFEIEHEDGLKQYGHSKENRPNPIVQMGLFMDGDGIPLAFSIDPGNTNEQTTLQPLESKIIRDFNLSKFIVCTDAGLASNANRKFNNICNRAFITTQSIKKLKVHLKDWALESTGWSRENSDKVYDISNLDEDSCKDFTYYKERWINENNLEQKLIVTYSIKYKNYQRRIRNEQIERARKIVDKNPSKIRKPKPNSPERFINVETLTENGEITDKIHYSIDNKQISKEEKYDGFYAVCTNLESDSKEIIKINHRRWEIEECFRIMKSEFEARPVYLSRDDRIKAHFITCFIALIVYRLLEKKLEDKYTCSQIITTLKDMNVHNTNNEGYIPLYTRTDLTDLFNETTEYRTDYQIISTKKMKKILKESKR